jgi:predicted dehydrogenase
MPEWVLMKIKTTRRRFLKSTLVGGGGLLILRDSRSARGYAANQKLNMALVGVGGRGKWFVNTIPKLGENVVALCDVNEEKAAEAFQKFPNVPKYHDYREMLEKMEKEIDAVIIATPDHSHAPCSVMAMKMGKHVYCEKPLTHGVHESRVLRDLARGTGVATQMGNQGTASGEFRRAVELIRTGAIGEVREVMVWNEAGGV